MNFNKISMAASAVCMLAMATSCDDIDSDDRYIAATRPLSNRVVVIQEFTGMQCGNCPEGAAKVHEILDAFPYNSIAVSMYPSTPPGLTDPYGTFDFRTQEATTYYNHYNCDGLPNAIFGGTGKSNATPGTWAKSATDAMVKATDVSLAMSTRYDATTREVTIIWESSVDKQHSGNLNIMFWLTENNLKAPQLDFRLPPNANVNFNYIHNHVFRCSVNGTWGERIEGLTPETPANGTATVRLNEKWNVDNCHIVGIVLDSSSKAFAQAAEVPVI